MYINNNINKLERNKITIKWNNINSYVLIMFDPNSPIPNWIHLYIPYIHSSITSIDFTNNINNSKIIFGNNSWNRKGYNGPDPPSGIHCYVFSIIALNYNLKDKINSIPTVKDCIKLLYDNNKNSEKKVVYIKSKVGYFSYNNDKNFNKNKCKKYNFTDINKLYKHFEIK